MSDAHAGFASLADGNNQFNQIDFLVRQVLSKTATTTLVQVVAVDGAVDAVAPVGLMDVRPLVGQIDGAGKITPHGTIHNVPYFRLQGGTSAVIIDPKPGDIGIAVFASHDISTVKNTKKAAGPGTRRRFDWADALYIGGVLNGAPEQFVRFSADGVEIISPTAVSITAPVVTVDASDSATVTAPVITLAGDVTIDGTLETSGAITAGGDVTGGTGLTLNTHVHEKVQVGTAKSGGPVVP